MGGKKQVGNMQLRLEGTTVNLSCATQLTHAEVQGRGSLKFVFLLFCSALRWTLLCVIIPRQMLSVESHQVFELAFLTGHGLQSLSPPKPVQQWRLLSSALKHSHEKPKTGRGSPDSC